MTRLNAFWGTSSTANLTNPPQLDNWTQLANAETALARKFMSVRKNYGPDNSPIISAELSRHWTEGRRFQYENGKPNPNPAFDAISPTTGNAIGGTYWASVAAGHYDSVYVTFFEAVRTAGMWTTANPLAYSFHHEQYVVAEGGGADYGTKAQYIAFHRHVYNLMVNGSGGKGPWHVSAGGNMRVAFVPHWRQFYEDQVYGSVAATGNVVGYTFSDLDPGGAYYELLGADIYCYNGESFTASAQWTPLRAAALARGKPFITGETGVAKENGDAFVVNYLKALDTLLQGWGGGSGAGKVVAINWTDRVVNTPGKAGTAQALSDLRLDTTAAITAQYKAMANNSFYAAGLNGDFSLDAGGTGPSAPTVAVQAVTSITQTGMTLNGTVNPNGATTTGYFEWGPTSSYGTKGATLSPGAGTSSVAVSQAVTGLSASQTIHYRLHTVNSVGNGDSADQTATTSPVTPGPPVCTVSAATSLTGQSATLHGSVDGQTLVTTYHWEYGLTTAYGTSTTQTSLPSGAGAHAVATPISGLTANTTYNARLVATNSSGTTPSANVSFRTPLSPAGTLNAIARPVPGERDYEQIDTLAAFQINHAYTISGTPLANLFKPGNLGAVGTSRAGEIILQLTQAGTSGGSEPAWGTSYGAIITSGTAKFKVLQPGTDYFNFMKDRSATYSAVTGVDGVVATRAATSIKVTNFPTSAANNTTGGSEYYAYDLVQGLIRWRFYALNSALEFVRSVGPAISTGSAQYAWLQADVTAYHAANPTVPILAYFHHPVFSAVEFNGFTALQSAFALLVSNGCRVFLTAHAHAFQRMLPLDHTFAAVSAPGGVLPAEACVSFGVGNGGAALSTTVLNNQTFTSRVAPSATGLSGKALFGDSYGGLQLQLDANGFSWNAVKGADASRNQVLYTSASIFDSGSYTFGSLPQKPTAPTINTKPSNPTTSTSANFTWSDTDATITQFKYQLDGGGYNALSGATSVNYAGLSTGAHKFDVIANNGVDSDPTSWSWSIHAVNPVPAPTITSAPSNGTTATTAVFEFSDSFTTAVTFFARVDAGAFVATSSPATYVLTPGGHSFDVYAHDPLGNVDSATTSYSWSIQNRVASPLTKAVWAFYDADHASPLDFAGDTDYGTWGGTFTMPNATNPDNSLLHTFAPANGSVASDFYPAALSSALSPTSILDEMRSIQAAGIDILLVKWSPPPSRRDTVLAGLFSAVRTVTSENSSMPVYITVAIDGYSGSNDSTANSGSGQRNNDTLVYWMNYLINTYGAHPNLFLTQRPGLSSTPTAGVPVYLLLDPTSQFQGGPAVSAPVAGVSHGYWSPTTDACHGISSVATGNAVVSGGAFLLTDDTYTFAQLAYDGFDGGVLSTQLTLAQNGTFSTDVYQRIRAYEIGAPAKGVFIARVAPGFSALRTHPAAYNRRNARTAGSFYDDQWKIAIQGNSVGAAQPDVMVQSWNDWQKGTQIAPSASAAPQDTSWGYYDENSLYHAAPYTPLDYEGLDVDGYVLRTLGWTNTFQTKKTTADYSGLNAVRCHLGTGSTVAGRVFNNEDGLFQIDNQAPTSLVVQTKVGTVGGRKARSAVASGSTNRAMYFDVLNSWQYQLAGTTNITVSATYYDAGFNGTTHKLTLIYDGQSGANTSHATQFTLGNSKTWKTATWQTTNAYFGGRQLTLASTGLGDFRLQTPDAADFWITHAEVVRVTLADSTYNYLVEPSNTANVQDRLDQFPITHGVVTARTQLLSTEIFTL